MKAMEKEPVYWLEKYPFELPLLNASYQKVVDWLEKYPKVSLDKRGKSIHIKHNDFIRYPQELENGEKGTLIHITCTQSGLVITGHHHYLAKLENEQPLPSEWLKTFIENITLYFNTFELPTAQVDAGKPEVDAGKYDELCRKWVNRPSVPYRNKSEFLNEYAPELLKKTFDRILSDAFNRDVIDKNEHGHYIPKKTVPKLSLKISN